MEPKKLLQADYLDIIFDNRNKTYGGYELRRNYDRRAKKAMGMVLLGVAAIFSCSFIAAHRTGTIVRPELPPTIISDVFIQPKTVIPKIIPPTPPPPPQHLKTDIFTPPKIVDNTAVPDDKQMTENKNLHNVQPGPANADGDSASISPVSSGTGKGNSIVPTTTSNTNSPLRWVAQMPQFPGDMDTYIGKHLNYPDAARSASIEGRVVIEFVVNENGSVSNAKIVRGIGGGCDEEALRMVSGMPAWKPGKQNGVPVKVLFTLPISFVLN